MWQIWTLCLPSVCLFYLWTLRQTVIGISKSIFGSDRLVWTIRMLEQWLLTEATALPYWHEFVVTRLRICLNSEPLSHCRRECPGGGDPVQITGAWLSGRVPGGRLYRIWFLSVVSGLIRYLFVVLTVLAGSSHLAYGTLRFVSVRFPLAVRPCLGGGGQKIFYQGPNHLPAALLLAEWQLQLGILCSIPTREGGICTWICELKELQNCTLHLILWGEGTACEKSMWHFGQESSWVTTTYKTCCRPH